jgi:uncharacterized membrane protein YcaP (DUF421 family)
MSQWLADVFSCPDGVTLLGIVGRSALIYLVVVIAMRLVGSRDLGRMNAYDFVLVVVLANAVQNALVGGDNTLVGGLASAATLLAMNWGFTRLLDRFPQLEKRMDGEPVLFVSDGQVLRENMRREGVTNDELMAALREHGVTELGEVRMAVLEVDGTISVVPRDAKIHRTHRRFRGHGPA